MNDLFSENLRKQVSNGKLSSPSVYFSAGRIYGQALSFEVSGKGSPAVRARSDNKEVFH